MEFALCFPSSELPSYSPSAPLPSYSCELSCGERRLEHTPRSRSAHSQPSTVFIKKAGKTTVILNEQHEGVAVPSYGRRALITGSLILEQSEGILEVVIKVNALTSYPICLENQFYCRWKPSWTPPFPRLALNPLSSSTTITPCGRIGRSLRVPVPTKYLSPCLCPRPSNTMAI
jgi:hypothetical protein